MIYSHRKLSILDERVISRTIKGLFYSCGSVLQGLEVEVRPGEDPSSEDPSSEGFAIVLAVAALLRQRRDSEAEYFAGKSCGMQLLILNLTHFRPLISLKKYTHPLISTTKINSK